MISPFRIWLTILVLVCFCNSTTSAKTGSFAAEIREQLNKLEDPVLAERSTPVASSSTLLTEQHNHLRASIQLHLVSLRNYQLGYGHRFSIRERSAVDKLIQSLEMDLESLERTSGSAAVVASVPVKDGQARKVRPVRTRSATAFLAIDDPTPTPTPEPTPTPTPTPDPEIEKANKEKTLAEASKAASEAKKAASEAETAAIAAALATLRARLGLGPTDAGPTATAPAGTITAGDAPKFIETQILSETGVRMASAEVLKQMCGLDGAAGEVPALKKTAMTTLVINNSMDRAAISKYRITLAQLDFLHDHYKKLIEQSSTARDDTAPTAAAAPLLIPAATQIVKNVADLLNLFRTDTVFNSQTVTVDSRMVVTTLANRLLAINNQQCKVTAIYEPAVYALTVPKTVKSGPLLDAYKKLLDDVTNGEAETIENAKKVTEHTKEKTRLEGEIAKLEAKIAEQKEKDAKKKKPRKGRTPQKPAPSEKPFDIAQAEKEIRQHHAFIDTELVPRIARLNQAASNLNDFKTSVKSLFQILTAVDDATKQPILHNLINAERLSDILAEPGTYVLDLSVKASGTNRTRRNMFFNTKVDHSGGVSIDANLFNNEDKLVFGRLEDFYIEFTGSKKIRERSGFKRLDQLNR